MTSKSGPAGCHVAEKTVMYVMATVGRLRVRCCSTSPSAPPVPSLLYVHYSPHYSYTRDPYTPKYRYPALGSYGEIERLSSISTSGPPAQLYLYIYPPI